MVSLFYNIKTMKLKRREGIIKKWLELNSIFFFFNIETKS